MVSLSNAVSGSSSTTRIRLTIRLRLPNSIQIFPRTIACPRNERRLIECRGGAAKVERYQIVPSRARPADDLRPPSQGSAAADPGRPPRLHDRGTVAADQRRRIETPARIAEHRRHSPLPRPGVRHGHPGPARGSVGRRHHRGHALRLDRRQPRAPDRPQLLDPDEPHRRQEPRGSPSPRASRPTGVAADPHRLRPVHFGGTRAGSGCGSRPQRTRAFPQQPEVRIIAGEWRGRRLRTPPSLETRPTADRVRETLFSMLASRLGSFEGLRVADLFAGSGALGLEALSRGAGFACFVENDSKAAAAIRANATALNGTERVQILGGSALALPRSEPFDLVFADPPYAAGSGTAAVQ